MNNGKVRFNGSYRLCDYNYGHGKMCNARANKVENGLASCPNHRDEVDLIRSEKIE